MTLTGRMLNHSDAGGGGERVLWTAIAWAQRTHPGQRVLCVVYTGDYPAASKEEIVHKVKVSRVVGWEGGLRWSEMLLVMVIDEDWWCWWVGTIRYLPRPDIYPFRASAFTTPYLGFVLETVHPARSKCRVCLVGDAGFGMGYRSIMA
jgi:hypothetical protein